MNIKHRSVCINIYIYFYWKTLIHTSHIIHTDFTSWVFPRPVAHFLTLPTRNSQDSPEKSKICYVKLFHKSNTFWLEKNKKNNYETNNKPFMVLLGTIQYIVYPPLKITRSTVSPLSVVLQAVRKWNLEHLTTRGVTNPQEQETYEP